MRASRLTTVSLRLVALGYLALLLIIPVGVILYRSFEHGPGPFFEWITTPAAISAIWLSIKIVLIVVPLNVVFGVATAIFLVRSNSRLRGLVQALVDLPFAVSPVIVGLALVLLWGEGGWFAGLSELGIKIIFSLPGMVLATLFVTLPFVVREVEPVLQEIGEEQEQAASTLGANSWQTFRMITLPSIRWGLAYGVVLTVARSLGEFGAVSVVSAGVPGQSQTLTLLVSERYDQFREFGAYSAATLLMMLALVSLILMALFERRKENR